MLMINLILILLVGGVLALLSERLGETMPRKVALVVVLVDTKRKKFPSITINTNTTSKNNRIDTTTRRHNSMFNGTKVHWNVFMKKTTFAL